MRSIIAKVNINTENLPPPYVTFLSLSDCFFYRVGQQYGLARCRCGKRKGIAHACEDNAHTC